MVRAPGASLTSQRASYGLPSKEKVDRVKVGKIAELMAEGYSRGAATGQVGLGTEVVAGWENKFPDVREVLDLARLRRLYKLETGFLDETSKMPQIVARIFALKNADPENWQERQGNFAVGLSANITVVTGVPEPNTQIEATPNQEALPAPELSQEMPMEVAHGVPDPVTIQD